MCCANRRRGPRAGRKPRRCPRIECYRGAPSTKSSRPQVACKDVEPASQLRRGDDAEGLDSRLCAAVLPDERPFRNALDARSLRTTAAREAIARTPRLRQPWPTATAEAEERGRRALFPRAAFRHPSRAILTLTAAQRNGPSRPFY